MMPDPANVEGSRSLLKRFHPERARHAQLAHSSHSLFRDPCDSSHLHSKSSARCLDCRIEGDRRSPPTTEGSRMLKYAESTFFGAATIGALALAAVIAVQEVALEPAAESFAAAPVVRLQTAEVVGERSAARAQLVLAR
jgi:hypothetical protein